MDDFMQRVFHPDSRFPVIVRTWGDEPVRLYLYRIENNMCFVGSKDCKKPIGLPANQVFAFDLDKFDALFTAFQHGQNGRVSEQWAKQSVDDFACIKQTHKQVHIPDSK
jgi:hypothetical protein